MIIKYKVSEKLSCRKTAQFGLDFIILGVTKQNDDLTKMLHANPINL